MISFNLRCGGGHEFEGWFSSSDDYDRQHGKGLVSCPVCGDGEVSKALMAPNVGAKANRAPAPDRSPAPERPPAPPGGGSMQVAPPPGRGKASAPDPDAVAAAYGAIRALQRTVEAECDYVGDRFADEARKIHYGETEERGIYGQSSLEDARELRDEGINVAAIPWLPAEN